ncbi:MAG: hypothetical protein H3C47_00515 [Candidatus Cloacimonetes bacterium]|nr:hypothetical protein [Candidatus Cloacimonadota bacterium]
MAFLLLKYFVTRMVEQQSPLYVEGVHLQEKKDLSGAEAKFLELLSTQPDFVRARLRLIDIYREQREFTKLMGELKILIDEYHSSFEADELDKFREEFAHLCFTDHQYGEAMRHYLLLLSRGNYENPGILSRLVYLYTSQGLYERAIGLFSRIPPQNRDVETRFSAALAYYGHRQFDMVRNILLDLIADRQESPFHYYLLAKALSDLSDNEGALNYFKVYLNKQSESSEFVTDAARAVMRSFYQRTRYHSAQECVVWEEQFERILLEPLISSEQRREIQWQKALFGYFARIGQDPKSAVERLRLQLNLDPEFKEFKTLENLLSSDLDKLLDSVQLIRDYYNEKRIGDPFLFEQKLKLDPITFYRIPPFDVAQIESSVDNSFLSGLREFLVGKERIGLKDFPMLGSKQIQLHVTRFFRNLGFDQIKPIRTERSDLFSSFLLSGRSRDQIYARVYPGLSQLGEVEMNQAYSEMINRRYDSCLVLTMGTFTAEASSFGNKHSIRMVSGPEFQESYLMRVS